MILNSASVIEATGGDITNTRAIYAAAHERPPMPAFKGARTLAEYANRKIHVECLRCEIQRRYDGSAMLARAGGDMVMPDLINRIARGNGCSLNDAPTPNGIRCAMRYASVG